MTLRYWLALLCVTLSCGVLCVCDPYSSYSDRASSSNVWRELGWPALPDFRRPVNRRPYQSWSRSSYPFPRRGSLPATEEASDPHPRWSDARSASVPFETRVHDTQPNRYLARRPAPTTEIENARPKLYTSTGRRQGKQWLVPRRFLTSPGTGRGQGSVNTCSNGKIWRHGRCECPYLSNWNDGTNKCECVYGTYRHTSGTCRSY